MESTDGRLCRECDKYKPAGDFYHYPTGGLYTRCKPCHYVRTRRNRANSIERIRERERERYRNGGVALKRARKRLSKYGLTPEGYAVLMKQQRGVCPICLEPLVELDGMAANGSGDWSLPSIDHCHETGKVRGILHRRCNTALEFLLTDEALARARQYLAS